MLKHLFLPFLTILVQAINTYFIDYKPTSDLLILLYWHALFKGISSYMVHRVIFNPSSMLWTLSRLSICETVVRCSLAVPVPF